MSTVTKSIGTSGRDYSTITAWEADLDNAAVYASGDHAVGECYNDSVFDEAVVINGGGTIGLASVTLSVASGQRHTGTAGTGARVVRTAWSANDFVQCASAVAATVVEWLEFTRTNSVHSTGVALNGAGAGTNTMTAQRLIVHGCNQANPAGGLFGIGTVANAFQYRVLNNVVYDIKYSGGSAGQSAFGIRHRGTSGSFVHGNTVYNTSNTHATDGTAINLSFADDSDTAVKNVASADATAVTASCFSPASPSNAVVGTNLSSDATASGIGSLVNKTSANQFVSTVAGSEDLHLKTGADAIDAGTDLGTTPTGVNIDIDGRDRDAEGDVWDIGADEWVATVARFPWQVRRERRMAGAR